MSTIHKDDASDADSAEDHKREMLVDMDFFFLSFNITSKTICFRCEYKFNSVQGNTNSSERMRIKLLANKILLDYMKVRVRFEYLSRKMSACNFTKLVERVEVIANKR